jgi:putative hemolysin
MTPFFRLVVAQNARQIADAQRVRRRVYVEEEGLLDAATCSGERERDHHDEGESTTHLLVYAGSEAVGTLRLLRAGAPTPSGLELESKFILNGFAATGIVAAEVTRYCVLQRYRGTRAAAMLFAGLLAESARSGVTHWVAGANMQTDSAEDAEIAHQLVTRLNLSSDRFCAEPRRIEPFPTRARRCLYDDEQRARAREGDYESLELPSTLSLFATRLGARYMGAPVYDSYFNVFALPLVAVVSVSAKVRAGSITARDAQSRPLDAHARV